MHKYTQEEFDALPVEYGRKQCPTGDYSNIDIFPAHCSFGRNSVFGAWCSFGESCRFGEHCDFGDCCSFGRNSVFGAWCSFGEWSKLGERCSFGQHCVCEFGEFSGMVAFVGFGREGRTTYAFGLTDGGIGVRCGCFAGNLDEFREQVRKTHGKTKYAKDYLALAALVARHFAE